MRKLIISLSAAFAILAPLAAQDLETGYFLGGNPYAFRLNPAFQSERNILSIGLGMTGLSAISNLGFSTMLYPEGGKLYTCLNDHVSASELLGKLHRNNYMDLGARVNLLTVGFWSRRNFFTIDINVRNQEGVSLPYDLFRFIKGDKTEGSVFECASIGIRSQTFAEAAFGWSRSFDNHLSVGVRGKFIVGALGEDLTLNKLRVTIGDESWSVDSHGRLTVSSPAFSVGVVEDTDIMDPRSFNFDWSKAGPAGWGGALDLGFRYDITPLLTVSGALLDLGAIRWNQEIAYETPDKTYEWAPSSEKTSASGFLNEVMELLSVGSGFLAWREDKDAHPEFRLMPFRVNAGAEFRMPFYDRLSVGALYQGHFVNTFARHTGRMSLNWNPWDFLSLSTSATFTRLGESMGVALNLHPNGINLVLGCDYIPFHCVDLSPVLEDVDPKYARFLRCPRDQFKLNAYVGLNIAFGKFPLNLYKGCPYYVPNLYVDEMSTLDMSKNPMGKYAKCEKYLAYNEKGEVVGRVAAIINEIANRDWNHAEVRFGWMDFIDDKEVSRALIEAVIAFGRRHGMTQVSGPLGFTDFDNEGCVVEGFDDISSFMLKYNYPYYASHFEALGFGKVNDWLEYRIFVPEKVPEKVTKAAAIVTERYGLHVRKITKREVSKEQYGQKIFDLVNRTYCELFDFTVLPPDVVDQYIKTFLGLLDLDFVILVEDAEGKLVGFALTMPSLAHAVHKSRGYLFPLGWWHIVKSMYLKHEDALELMLIAVDPEYRNRGVNAILFNELIPKLIKGGFKYGESNAEMESNNSVQNLWNLYQKEFKRRRRVFSKEI